ncbi:MAG TPA: hypothetical protein PLM09_11120 [Casimicrobiaceae bacterium]|nr:hypothetical protein [Casimicrobiaceae bacterium]
MAQLTTVIVHGTWAAGQDWWKDTGSSNFWSYIKSLTSTLHGGADAFSWSGANQHADRVLAAHDLVQWCSSHGVERLQVIAHSHGCNVCYVASQLGLKFENLIALAGPVRIDYLPDMRRIESLHNVFSEYDLVQTPAGTLGARRGEGRTLGDSSALRNQHVPNWTAGNTSVNVGHSDVHDPVVWQGNDLDRLVVVQ